jgi:membrane protease YdiL (CAAX protease family)
MHDRIAYSVLAGLLILRIPFVIGIIHFLPIDQQWGGTVYEVSAYLLTAFLIWWERARLADYHLDDASLALLILCRPLQTVILARWGVDSPLALPRLAGILIWAIAAGLAVALIRGGNRPARVGRRTAGWLAIGLLAGLIFSVLENLRPFQALLQERGSGAVGFGGVLASAAITFFYHLGFAPIIEEPLFRGFLWGALRRAGWRESRVLFFQAGLFTLAHVYFAAAYPLRFWIGIPAAGLLFGLLAWRSRSLAPGMFAHAAINASAYVILLGGLPVLWRWLGGS